MEKSSQLQKGWSTSQIASWYNKMQKQEGRDYYRDIVSRLKRLPSNTHLLERYGSVDPNRGKYPLYCVTAGNVLNGNPNILITGGVHGYEPSGIEASVRFLEKEARKLSNQFNFVVFPCISPWSYEHNHRWNWKAEDPNRCFAPDNVPDIDECRHFMNNMAFRQTHFDVAIDLHETPDRDIELRQERAGRFGTRLEEYWQHVPQGYYLMLTRDKNEQNVDETILFGQSIINEVQKISPIASEVEILENRNHSGMTLSPAVKGTMRSYLKSYATHIAITEVYPDHPRMNKEKAVQAQLASIHGALKFIK